MLVDPEPRSAKTAKMASAFGSIAGSLIGGAFRGGGKKLGGAPKPRGPMLGRNIPMGGGAGRKIAGKSLSGGSRMMKYR